MTSHYVTLGSGQPYYPGYFECRTDDKSTARDMANKALNGRWCSIYETLEDIHQADENYRGYIDVGGLNVL